MPGEPQVPNMSHDLSIKFAETIVADRSPPSAKPSGIARPAKPAEAVKKARMVRADGTGDAETSRVLIVDLNNFASFPTLAVGILVAALRNASFAVEVLCPLAHDVPAVQREHRETIRDHVARRIHLSTWPLFRRARDLARTTRNFINNRPHPVVLREIARVLASKPDIILLSAYLQHYQSVVEIGKLAKSANIPLVVGGPMFNVPEIAESWLKIPGLVAMVGAESDLTLPALVRAACRGEDLLGFPGVKLPDLRSSPAAPPLRELDAVPVPDFSDFPWDRYASRIIPVMTGRGCQWSKCVFCSDVVSVSGRTFRSRSIDNIMHELREQARRYGSKNFLFLDLKLNSNPNIMRGICDTIQDHVYGAQWVGTVHVDLRKDNGLSRKELKNAANSGMRRISFGLETGSQRLLDDMKKGSSVEANSEFIRNASEAGLSIRCTMFKGFPSETADDLEQTADFLEKHEPFLDRVRFNEFSIPTDTPIYDDFAEERGAASFSIWKWDHRNGRALYIDHESGNPAYRRAKARALRAVYQINKREVRSAARAFDGLM